MGLNVKLGKGGHGLEVYDEEGKYAKEFSFQVGDQIIKGYEDFKSLYFASLAQNSAGQYSVDFLDNLYKSNPNFQEQVDAQLYPEYNKALTDAVNDYNAKQVWDTPEEAAQHLEEIFVPSFVNNLIENGILNSDRSSVASGYAVDTFAACLQMSRYKRNRANLISKQDYLERRSTNLMPGHLGDNTPLSETEAYIKGAIEQQKDIPLNRDIDGVRKGDQANVMASFYDENSPRHSCLSANGSGYLGSVIYMSTGDYQYSPYSSLSIRGLVRMNDKLRLLECPLKYWDSGRYSCNNSIPELSRFRNAVRDDPNFNKRMTDKIKEYVSDPGEADIIVRKLRNRLEQDPGFCAMLLGYDAIWGCGYHFDILNLGICDIVEQ